MGEQSFTGWVEMKDIVTGHSILRWNLDHPVPITLTDAEPIYWSQDNPHIDHGDMEWMYRCVACGEPHNKRNQLCDECLAIIADHTTDDSDVDDDWSGFFE